MFYQYITNIDDTDKFIYVTIILAGALLATRIRPSANAVLGAIVAVIVVYYLNEKAEDQGTTFVAAMKTILSAPIMKPHKNRHLAYNSELVIFLDQHREYHHYNPVLWNSLVKLVNDFLKLEHDIELRQDTPNTDTTFYNGDYDTMKATKLKILNTFHSFIHKLPHTESSNNKFHCGMKKLEQLLNTEIDHVHRLVANYNSRGIDTGSAFHYKNHPSGYERLNRSESAYRFFN